MEIILAVSTIGMLVGLFIAYWVHSRDRINIVVDPANTHPDSPDPVGKISVIVPARNEARNISRCGEALMRQDYPDYEMIIINDRSSDDTPRILQELQEEASRRGKSLQIIDGKELPADWAGKPHALVQGAESAQGAWLCFVDADTFANPEMLSAAYACAQQQGADIFTMLTHQEMVTFWEKTVLPLVVTALSFGFPAERVNDPEEPDAIAYGQFILIRRAVYEAVGGHTAVKERIDEDRALAVVVKKAGYRLIIADGRKLARTRMYTSLAEMWEGWTKNMYVGLSDRPWLLLFGGFVGLLGALVLPLWLLGALVWAAAGGGLPALVVLVQVGIVWFYLLWMRSRAGRVFNISPLYAPTLPMGALVFTGMLLFSAFIVISGQGVTWKGRRYRPLQN